ncbi:ABC transporter permease [Amycolatopsis sp. 195334CR]|uniref:ABC transporter permease n=1 Tax=Amycolatopsis sp. 195334CR TaxID=2814588 RepID=UPI001F5CC905|nr:ABC transporter permease [Amycolatopsis sp. 195334CR]
MSRWTGMASSGRRRWAVVVALLGAFVLGTLILAGTGADPLSAYSSIITGAFGADGFPGTLAYAVPVVGMAVALAVPLRAGMVNLGGEGQLVLGAIAGTVIGLSSPLPAVPTVILALLGGSLAGAAYAALAAFFENKLGVPLLVSTLLLSYPAMSFASYLVRFPLADAGSSLPQSERLPDGVAIEVTGIGLVLVAVAAVAYVVIDARAPIGYEIRMTGLGARFAAYAGISRPRLTLRVLATSGGLAGLVGAIMVLGFPHRFIDGALITPTYTWIGLLAALLAGAHPLGTVIAAFFFAALTNGGFEAERVTQAPRELTAVLQAVIIIFLAAATGLLNRRKAGAR